MPKLTIKNRKDQNIVLQLDIAEPQKGLVFVLHGLGGYKEQQHMMVMAESFKEAGFTVVNFDSINSYGESDGRYEDSTITTHYESLEDVIEWSKSQDWYEEPFCLTGHSLGAISVALYAENYPDKVRALAPISTVISGDLSLQATPKEVLEEWEKTGWRERPIPFDPGAVKRLPWSHMMDRLKYDLLPKIDKLTMPVILIVGERDKSTPPDHQKLLYNRLPGKKELHIIQGVQHTFKDENMDYDTEALDKIKVLLNNWIKVWSG